MKKMLVTVLASALLAAGAANAQGKADEKLPAPVALAVQGGMKFETTFPAPGGMTGYILSQGDQPMVLYVAPDGQTAIAGAMLDGTGKNLTRDHLAQYAPKPDYEKAWAELEKASYVATGAKGSRARSTIYVFEDANCVYCHYEYRALAPYLKTGLQVRWIPVAFLHADSYDKGAVFLAATDGDAALAEMHRNFGQHGGTTPPSTSMRARLDANAKLMTNLGFKGTPVTFYKDGSGKVRAVSGMFKLAELPTITGLPELPVDDKELLARFGQ